ncbi:hypothetical protein LP7551_02075 [Roseibium album]|nr:hypothetical protein LP7551_02075 [Roseibium album]
MPKVNSDLLHIVGRFAKNAFIVLAPATKFLAPPKL